MELVRFSFCISDIIGEKVNLHDMNTILLCCPVLKATTSRVEGNLYIELLTRNTTIEM